MRHTLSSDIVLTAQDIDLLVGEIADIDAAQARTQCSIDTLLSDRDAALDKIRAEYTDPLAALAGKARSFEAMRDAKIALVKSWADANKEKMFTGKKRSFSFQRGIIGYNLAKARLDIAEGESFESVAAKLMLTRNGRSFVELKPVLKKTAVLKAWLTMSKLFTRAGLLREQDDEFYFKTVEQTPDSLKAAA